MGRHRLSGLHQPDPSHHDTGAHAMNEAQLKLAILRSECLMNFYSVERRAGSCPLVANERMNEYAKRLDALFDQQQAAVKFEMEKAS